MPTIITSSTPEIVSSAQFVGNSSTTPLTVSSLISGFPPSASFLGWYARVSDLFGSVDDILRCRYDGVQYRWIPQRPNFAGTTSATGGTIPVTPLVTPPTLRLTANLLSNMTINPSATNAYIGMQQTIVQEGLLGLFSSTITGLIGSNITILGNTTKTIEYGPTGWFNAS